MHTQFQHLLKLFLLNKLSGTSSTELPQVVGEICDLQRLCFLARIILKNNVCKLTVTDCNILLIVFIV